jgi:histidinol-phosphate/aromatic aminotransferase/cobyric acid decarboxylase-like protein/SAM-dependent methyltransferase
MPAGWYERYFTEDYWLYADAEYTAERTAAEVDYLVGVLREHAPGPRVLDVGCGVGRHAVGLAQRGFEVVGVDVSEYALRRAGSAAAAARVPLTLHRVDLLGSVGRGLDPVDAVVCVQAFGWGTDADQLRLLRRLRRLLPDDGVLVLDHSNLLAIARRYRETDRVDIDGVTVEFMRRFAPVTGRSGGEVRLRRPDGSTTALPDDVRLYQPAEVRDLLRRSGFRISTVDADFTRGAPVTLDTRYVQFVAHPAATPRSALEGHRAPAPAGALDLRSAPDEAALVADELAAAWAQAWNGQPGAGSTVPGSTVDRARRYDLADPYGGGRLAPVLAAHLGWPAGSGPAPERVFTGAGATGLLHGLAGLAGGGPVLVDPAGHPGLAAAAAATGGDVRVEPLTAPEDARRAVARHRPAVAVLDRPGLTGPLWTASAVRELAEAVAAAGGVLVVDETCGGYLAPHDTCARLTDGTPGVVVVRSMSKGYCCGGLRVGYAIASPDLVTPVRELLPPLAVAAFALDLALALLARPDPLAALRRRIAVVKPVAAAGMAAAGLAPIDSDPRVPWLVLPGDPGTRAVLAGRGLVAKEVPVLGSGAALLRLSVPLSRERRRAFEAAVLVPTVRAGR